MNIPFDQGIGLIDGKPLVIIANPDNNGPTWQWQNTMQACVEIVSVNMVYTTSAVVSARVLSLSGLLGAQILALAKANNTIAASLSVNVTFARDVTPPTSTANVAIISMGRLFIPPQGLLACAGILGDGGDRITNVVICGIVHPLK